MKKLIAFDLDGTLAPSKEPVASEVAKLVSQLLGRFQVCAISGGQFERFQKQLIERLPADSNLVNLHIMPTNGTQYYRFAHSVWQEVYRHEMPPTDRQQIKAVLEEGARALGLWPDQVWGDVVEDRGSQVTYSGLGQEALLPAKKVWDPDGTKRQQLRDWVAQRLPECEVTVAGTTSIDVTPKGFDKAYGVKKLQETLGLGNDEVLFVGDQLGLGGNDHPVQRAGFETVAVKDESEIAEVIRGLLRRSTN